MAVSDGFRAFILDQLADLGDITARAMFGGVGLYCDGVFFGLLAGNVLYLKADEINRPSFEAAGGRAFKPYAHRPETMKYFSVPVGVLESSDELVQWGKQAVTAARRTSNGPSTKSTTHTKTSQRKPKTPS
jgi:DNA transformation protein and related proteins